MGRKNKHGWRYKAPAIDFEQFVVSPHRQHPQRPVSLCAYCGAELKAPQWHWVVDEFGQRVRKCNDAWKCWEHSSVEAKASYKRALMQKHDSVRLIRWIQKEQTE